MPSRSYRGRIESYLRRNPGASVAEARGHRGPADAERALRNASEATTRITGRDRQGKVTELTVIVTDRNGLDRLFRVKRGTPKGDARIKEANKDFQRKLRGVRNAIVDNQVDYIRYLRDRKSLFDDMMEGKAA